jgi:hypothetical protein
VAQLLGIESGDFRTIPALTVPVLASVGLYVDYAGDWAALTNAREVVEAAVLATPAADNAEKNEFRARDPEIPPAYEGRLLKNRQSAPGSRCGYRDGHPVGQRNAHLLNCMGASIHCGANVPCRAGPFEERPGRHGQRRGDAFRFAGIRGRPSTAESPESSAGNNAAFNGTSKPQLDFAAKRR